MVTRSTQGVMMRFTIAENVERRHFTKNAYIYIVDLRLIIPQEQKFAISQNVV
jgi:hypothetical protein